MIAEQLLVLTHEYPPRRGGIATYVAETARAAAEMGWPVTVLAPRDSQGSGIRNLRVLPTSVRGTQGWPDRWRMRRALLGLAVDWTRTTLWLPEPGPMRLWLYAETLRLPRPARLVLTLHGSEILRFQGAPHRRTRFARLLARADRIGVVSAAVEQLAANAGTPAPGALTRVPGAVQSALAAALAETPASRPAGPPWKILTVGRIHPRKGQLDVVEALGRLPAGMRAAIAYQLVGPVRRPRYLARLRQRADQLGVRLEGPVELPDPPALAKAYREATLMVLASRETRSSLEGFGLVSLEAAAAGCPVMVTDAGGAGDAVGPENGIVVPANRPASLAEAIEGLLCDAAGRASMGRAGPAWAARFTWERVVSELFGAPPETPAATPE